MGCIFSKVVQFFQHNLSESLTSNDFLNPVGNFRVSYRTEKNWKSVEELKKAIFSNFSFSFKAICQQFFLLFSKFLLGQKYRFTPKNYLLDPHNDLRWECYSLFSKKNKFSPFRSNLLIFYLLNSIPQK